SLTQVLASFGSNTNCIVAFFADSSTVINSRLTLTYRHSLSFPANVRAPLTINPLPWNDRIALTDLPVVASVFIAPCSASEILALSPYTELTDTLAGAFQTPLDPSTRA